MCSAAVDNSKYREIPVVKGLPFIGNTLEMAKDPAAFFVRAYKEYGPVFKINVFGRESLMIAGTEAALFMTMRDGREKLRSKEFWDEFRQFHGASRIMTGSDGEVHQKFRRIMRNGFSREAVRGRYHVLSGTIDDSIASKWLTGQNVPVLESFQYMIVQELGEILTGSAPLEYVRDIRMNILFLLNTLVTKQRPKFFLHLPTFKKHNRRFNELSEKMIKEFKAHAENGTLPNNLLGDIMRAHAEYPDLIPESDLSLLLTGPYVAGLDTVANTLAATVYGILKTPGLVERVQAEADALFAKETVTENDIRQLRVIAGSIREAMRLWPIAVAQMRTAVEDFEFEGCLIPKDETLYVGTSVPHFMEEYFPEPEKFDPERFFDDRAEHNQPGVYSPFGRGPHTCLGQNLAEVLMGTTIARLFHRLDMSLISPDYVLETKSAPTPGPATSFKVVVNGERKPAKQLVPEVVPEADATQEA